MDAYSSGPINVTYSDELQCFSRRAAMRQWRGRSPLYRLPRCDWERNSRSERPATGSPSDDEDTTVLPKTKWRDLGQSEPAASSSAPPAEPAVPAAPGRRRRSRRRQDDDDFGDFTYLHEPGDTDPGSRKDPGARGRTSL